MKVVICLLVRVICHYHISSRICNVGSTHRAAYSTYLVLTHRLYDNFNDLTQNAKPQVGECRGAKPSAAKALLAFSSPILDKARNREVAGMLENANHGSNAYKLVTSRRSRSKNGYGLHLSPESRCPYFHPICSGIPLMVFGRPEH